MKSQEEENSYKKSLLLAMAEKGINQISMIHVGLKKARLDSETRDFLPPPSRFAAWCKPDLKDFGLLSVEAAYEHAAVEAGKHSSARKWHDEVVRRAVGDVGFMRISSEKKAYVFTDFKRVYLELFEKYALGERFEFPCENVKTIQHKPLSKEENSERCKNLMRDMWPEDEPTLKQRLEDRSWAK